MDPRTEPTRHLRMIFALFSGIALLTTASVLVEPTSAWAQSEEALQSQKEHWQSRYRSLLENAARLEHNARISRENYAQAQRRNYPRGGARQRLMLQAEQAEAELADVREEIEALHLEAQREGALPGWFYEVDDEEISIPEPASPDTSGSNDDGRNPLYADDDDGRNPLYADDDDDDDDGGRNPLYADDE